MNTTALRILTGILPLVQNFLRVKSTFGTSCSKGKLSEKKHDTSLIHQKGSRFKTLMDQAR